MNPTRLVCYLACILCFLYAIITILWYLFNMKCSLDVWIERKVYCAKTKRE